jgi:hypothetical protein
MSGHHNHNVSIVEPSPDELYHHEESNDSKHENSIRCSTCNAEATYVGYPCRCCSFCKKCAMKMATGGKCKKCHQLFASMENMYKPPETAEPEE